MKKLFSITLALFLIVSSVSFVGCDQTNEVVELRFATQNAGTEQLAVLEAWADEIEEATDGEVLITIYSSSTLIGEEDMVSGIKAGLADIGDIVTGIYTEQLPLLSILELPFMALGDTDTAYQIFQQLWDEFPKLEAEFADFKVLFVSSFGDSGQIHTVDTEVRVPDDLAGLQLMVTGVSSQVMASAGASPVYMEMTDWHTSLERGLLQGLQIPWSGLYNLGLYPLTPYHTSYPSIAVLGVGMTLMNIDTWNSLSSDAQEALEAASADITAELMLLEADTVEAAIAAMEAEGGHTFITITEEEETLWYELAAPIHMEYIAELDAQGLPATELYERAMELAAEYE